MAFSPERVFVIGKRKRNEKRPFERDRQPDVVKQRFWFAFGQMPRGTTIKTLKTIVSGKLAGIQTVNKI